MTEFVASFDHNNVAESRRFSDGLWTAIMLRLGGWVSGGLGE